MARGLPPTIVMVVDLKRFEKSDLRCSNSKKNVRLIGCSR